MFDPQMELLITVLEGVVGDVRQSKFVRRLSQYAGYV